MPYKDGVRGWIVCLSCFVGNFILGGIKRSFGLALPSLKSYFDSDTSSLSLVASILEGMYYIVGPLASLSANKFGLRATSVIGSILTCAGLLISTTATHVVMMILFYSILGGTGLGFIYLPASVACNYYFEKKRGLATGLSKCGYSIGGIVCPLVANLVIANSGWTAMFYMFSCASFINCGFSFLLDPTCNNANEYEKVREDETSICDKHEVDSDQPDYQIEDNIVENSKNSSCDGNSSEESWKFQVRNIIIYWL